MIWLSLLLSLQTNRGSGRNASHTRGTKRWFWKTSSWVTHTSRDRNDGKSAASSTYRRDRSKYGFRIAEWRERSWTRERRPWSKATAAQTEWQLRRLTEVPMAPSLQQTAEVYTTTRNSHLLLLLLLPLLLRLLWMLLRLLRMLLWTMHQLLPMIIMSALLS